MVKLLVAENSKNGSLFTSVDEDSHNTKSKLTLDLIEENFQFNSWQAERFDSMKILGNEKITEDSFYVQKVGYDFGQPSFGKVLNDNVKGSYEIIQYPKSYEFLEYFLAEDLLQISAALNVDDKKFAITCDINLDNLSVVEGDELYNKVIIALSHDGSKRSVHFSTFDAVCENTLASSQLISMASKSTKKYMSIDSVKDIQTCKNLIDLANKTFNNRVLSFKKMQEVKLEKDQVENILKSIFKLSIMADTKEIYNRVANNEKCSASEKKYISALDSFKDPSMVDRFGAIDFTGYSLYNAVTHAVKNTAGKKEERSLYNEIYGSSMARENTKDVIFSLMPAADKNSDMELVKL